MPTAAFKLEITLGDRLMVGLQSLDLPIGVRIPVSQPAFPYGRMARIGDPRSLRRNG